MVFDLNCLSGLITKKRNTQKIAKTILFPTSMIIALGVMFSLNSLTVTAYAQNISRPAITFDDSTVNSLDDPGNNCDGVFTCTINSTTGWQGNGSLQFVRLDNLSTWSEIAGDELSVSPAQSYEIVTHMKLNDKVEGSHVVLEAFNQTSNEWYQLQQCPIGTLGPREWKEFRCRVVIPENTTQIRPLLNAGWSSDNGEEAVTLFDAISITAIAQNVNASMNQAPILNDPDGVSWVDPTSSCNTHFTTRDFTCTINSTTGWQGNGSLQFVKPDNRQRWSEIAGDELSVSPAQSYEIVTHMKLNDKVEGSHVVLEAFNQTSNEWYQLQQCPIGTLGPLEWKEFKCRVVIPENTTQIRPLLNAGWSSAGSAEEAVTLFDAITITPIARNVNASIAQLTRQ